MYNTIILESMLKELFWHQLFLSKKNQLFNNFCIISAKLVPLAYGIHKLQISCVVEDEKVSIDWLQETLQEIEDFVRIIISFKNII